MPRWLECLLALFALVILSPLFILLMLAIVIDSPGWPFFLQRRVGVNGEYFWMFKFRKMHASVPPDGKGITTKNDVRLTRMGRFLERFKLDELPQFINVLIGNMSLVGPRPEIPRFTLHYPEKWKQVLSVRPGVIGYSQVKTPHETDLYPSDCLDHEKYYIESILPGKLDNEITYIEKKSLWLDFAILLQVTAALITKTITLSWVVPRLSHIFMLTVDTALSCLSLYVGFLLVFQMGLPATSYPYLSEAMLFCLIVRPLAFLLFGLHKYPISSTITLNYLLTIIKASLYSSLIIIMCLMLYDERDLVLSAHLADAFLLPCMLTGVRIGYIVLHDSFLTAGSFQSLLRALTHLFVLFLHGMIGFFSFWISHLIRMQELNINVLLPRLGFVSLCAFGIRTVLSIFLWPPKGKTWRSFLGRDILRIVNVALAGTGLILVVYLILQNPNYSRVSLLLDSIIYALLSAIIALLWCKPQMKASQEDSRRKVILLGVGIESELLLSILHRIDSDAWQILGIVTDIEWKRFSSIGGVKIIGTIPDLESLFEVYQPDVLLTWEWMTQTDDFSYIKNMCDKNNVDLTVSPSVSSLLGSSGQGLL